MYQVNLGSKILYYPANDDFAIYDTEQTEDVGQAGEFSFKCPPTNPLYASLAQGQLITILKDGEEFWRGEIKSITYDFAKIADVYCLEDLAWLADEFLPPASITNETYAQRFSAAITAYNANRPADRQFAVGYITNKVSTSLCTWITEYDQSILDDLRNCICGDTGYIRVRRVTSGGVVTRYIDIVRLADYGTQATQPIEYGYNLLDYVKDSDYGNLTNVLTPYGEELEGTEVYMDYAARLQGTTISSPTSIQAFGRHAKAVIFDGVTDVDELNSLAAAYLSRYSQPQLTMEVEAVDLGEIENVDSIRIGDQVRIIAKPFAVDQFLYLTKIKRDLQNIDKNSITLSGYVNTGRTLTSQSQASADAIKNMPSKANILEAAKHNALEILNGTDGGYVTFETDAQDRITELRIANNIDYSQATKCWRWNLGGLAYMERSSGDPTAWTITTAATMDGGIVADFITSGLLTLQNAGVTLRALDTDDTEVVKVDQTGLYAIKGTIAGFTIKDDIYDQGFIRNDGDVYCKYGFTGYTIGKLINNSYWVRTDYVPDSGYLRIDYGSLSNGGLWITNAGNNSYWNMGDHYVHVYATNIYSSDYGYPTWSGSDRRIKRDIEDLPTDEAKLLLMSLRPRKFQMKLEDGGRMGFVAQEVREVIPDDCALEYGTEDMRCIQYNDLTAPLVACIKDLYAEIAALKEEIKLMKGAENG